MPRTKVTPELVAEYEEYAKHALYVLHSWQQEEASALTEYHKSRKGRVDAEKRYAAEIRRFKLAEAKLPPPSAVGTPELAVENIESEVLAEESLGIREVWVNGEPVEV